jgi:MFS family permease
VSRARVAVAAAAVLLSAADTYVVVLALPDMMAGVGLGLDELQRGAPLVSGFLLGYVVVLAVAGRVSDAAGRVPVLVACLLLFAAGSLLTASAPDLAWAVAGRTVQGLGAGGLVPPTLALVADTWPPRRRAVPLGVVGAAQEAGAVAGPLLGAAILAAAGWRTIFWVNLAAALVLAGALVATRRPRRRPARPPTRRTTLALGTAALAGAAVSLTLLPPDALATDVTLGALVVPLAGESRWASPLGLAALGLAATAVVTALAGAPVRALVGAFRRVDLPGAALLGVVLAAVVLVFAGAEIIRSPVDDRWPWLLALGGLAAGGFAVRQVTADHPLIPAAAVRARGAWGALLVNLLLGAALVTAVVNVPIFARVTRHPDSQLAAALVLLQFLAALPVGAVAGGWLSHRLPPRAVAAAGLALGAGGLAAMATWDADALGDPASSAALVAAGLGFGLAVAPVTAVLLAVTPAEVHGLASALVILARTVGMLAGLSVLTAVGLRVFAQRQAAIGSPFELCPDSPADCPAYAEATLAALIAEQQVIFAGGAACAATAAVAAAVLLALPRPGHARAGGLPRPDVRWGHASGTDDQVAERAGDRRRPGPDPGPG